MIPFNIPPHVDKELEYIAEALKNNKICGNGPFGKLCQEWMQEQFGVQKVLLTTSGTTALDMALLLCNFQPDDEVIMPSFTFCSTANAAVLAGAKIVFVDIRPDTMNMDEMKIEKAITTKTKAIVVVHYAGIACEMNTIMQIAKTHNLLVIEDAAQGIMASYHDHALGTIGDFGCYSFHETKNFSMGEGGALLINNPIYNERAEILWEKGTNRNEFLSGKADKYFWRDYGSAYTPSELNAACLWAQLQEAIVIHQVRLALWNRYYKELNYLQNENKIQMPFVPADCRHNALCFWIKLRNSCIRSQFISFMKEHDIIVSAHYPPLHTTPAGIKFGIFCDKDEYTTAESAKLVRLPLYYNLKEEDQIDIIQCIKKFFETAPNLVEMA